MLRHRLKNEALAAAVFEQAVLHAAEPLPFHDPAFANRLRELLGRQMPSAARSKLEHRLSEEDPGYLGAMPPAGESRGDTSRVQAGGLGDVWRVGDSGADAPLAQHAAGTAHTVDLDGLGEVTLQPLAAAPASFVIDGFATAEECAALVAAGAPLLVPSMITSSAVSAHRTSSSAEWLHHRLDLPVVRTLLQRAAQLVSVGKAPVQPSDFELQVVHYEEEQQYKLHYDATMSTDHITNGMARYVTALLYLSDVEEGGETLLPLADDGLKEHGCVDCDRRPGSSVDWREDACTGCVKPRMDEMLKSCGSATNSGVVAAPQVGRLVVWYNYLPDGRWDPRALHAGCKVRKGEKWAANIWLDRLSGAPLFRRDLPGAAAKADL